MPALQKGRFDFGGKIGHLLFALQAVDSQEAVKPLVRLVQSGQVSRDREENVLALIAGLGGPEELAMVFDRVLQADAMAAKRVNPHWKAPRNAWGQPDLEGIWTTDDMRGVPMSRQQQYGTRTYLTDDEFAQRAQQRNNARSVDNARTGTFRKASPEAFATRATGPTGAGARTRWTLTPSSGSSERTS